MRALVIGYGSIGARHARVLAELGTEVAVVSRREVTHERAYGCVRAAVDAFPPDYVVVASRTSEHRADMEALAACGFDGALLVEKPLFDSGDTLPEGDFATVKVAYNLRFHPAVCGFRDALAGRNVYGATAYVGSYLPDWRPGVDYRQTSSARRAYGGGALRELSHEIDYLLWSLGPWKRVAALGGKFTDLEIDTDDVFALMFETEQVPAVSLQMNYIDSKVRRDVLALTDEGAFRLDLVSGTLETPSGAETFEVARDDTYRAEHEAMLNGDESVICGLDEGLEVMRMIDAAEAAAEAGTWITR